MKICMVTSAPMPPREGLGYYVWNLSRYLVEQGHGVQIITRGQRGKPLYETVQDIPIWRPRFYPVYPLHVHLHGLFVQPIVRRLEFEVDVFHLHTPLPPPIRSKRPNIVTVHTPMLGEAKAIAIRDLRSLIIRLQIPISACVERKLFDAAHQIVTVSQSVADELCAYGVSKQQVRVFGNGVNTEIFCPDAQNRSMHANEQYVLAAGRLDVRKGLQDLIQAMTYVHRHYPDVRLYIAGVGPLERQLRTQVGQLGLEGIVLLLGHVDRSKMVELYRGAMAFVHAAHYEGLPTVLLEAMACGKAVISTAVGGALDVVQDGINGFLVSSRATEEIADSLCRLLADGPMRNRLGTAARQTVIQRFSWQVVGKNYLHCYRDLVAQRAR